MSLSAFAAGVVLFGVGQQGPDAQSAKNAAHISTPRASDRRVELLLVDVLYKRLRLTDALAALQDEQGRRYVPVRELARALDFRLYVDAKKRIARGFLSAPTDRIDFDGITGKYKRKNEVRQFDPALCFEQDNELYVDAELFGDVAGLHFYWRINRLELEVQSDLPLTVKARDPNSDALARPTAAEPPLERVETPYRLWSMPSFDIQLYSTAETGEDAARRSSWLSFDGVGDLAYMSAHYRLMSGSDGKPVARLTMSREDSGGRLFGLSAKKLSFGDLNLSPVPLISRARGAVGFTLSNFPLPGEDQGTSEQIEGRAPHDSIVELYRDNLRIDSTRADAEGRYVFANLQLEAGPNTFRIVVVTSDGELREEERTLYGDASGPRMGQSRYRVTAAQTGSSLFGSEGFSGSSHRQQELIGEYQVGISSGAWLSATGAVMDDEAYAGAAYYSWSGRVRWRLQTMLSERGGMAWSTGLSRKFGSANLSLEHTRISGDYSSAYIPEITAGASAVTRLRLDGVGGRRYPVSYGLSIDRFEGSTSWTQIRGRLSGGGRNLFLSNSLAARLDDGPFDATGLLQIRKRFGPSFLRLDLGYGLGESSGLNNARLSYDRRLSANYRFQYGIEYDATRESAFAALGTVYRMVGPLGVGLQFSVDENGAIKASLLLSTGIAGGESFGSAELTRPGAVETGSVVVRAFVDRNLSGKLDDGDVLLPNIGLRLAGRPSNVRTGATGSCTLERILPNQDITVALDEDTFDDPCWTPAKPGVIVVARAGTLSRIDLAIIEAAEIEGRVRGEFKQHGSLIAELRTKSGVAYTSYVDGDGVYAFSRVRPGEYALWLTDLEGNKLAERPVRATAAGLIKGCDLQVGE